MTYGRLWVVAVGALALCLSACHVAAPESSAKLVMPGDQGAATAALPNTIANRDYSFGGLPLCLASGQSVHLTKVSAIKPKGLVVSGFAIREHPTAAGDFFGNADEPLAEVGFDPESVEVRIPCSAPRPVELAVQVRRGKLTGSAEQLLVTYVSNGRVQTTRIPFGITLCSGRDKAVPDCLK